jgi:hypothetical protein
MGQAAQETGGLHIWTSIDPLWATLRSHPAMQEILARWPRRNGAA